MQQTKVLIIGAGPTGLMAACQLRRQGIDCTIIDKKEGPTRESRALVLHARSLEIYDQMGIAGAALAGGALVRKVQFFAGTRRMVELPVGLLGAHLSPFPFVLVLEQSRNEALLYRHLQEQGGEVLWQTELTGIRQEDEAVVVQLQKEGGNPFSLSAGYVVAADGGKSTVRHALNVPFKGSTYAHIFYVADTALESAWPHDALTVCLSGRAFMALFPMQGPHRFRVIGALPPNYPEEHPASFEAIVPFIRQQVRMPLRFSDTSWFSVYRLHHRCLEHFRQQRIFFAGDAAHIHSPAGGQGMNTGLQDAYNLAWKLALTIKGLAADWLLDTYEQERLPVAQKLVRSTDRAFAIATSGTWYHRWLRTGVLPLLLPLLFRWKKQRLNMFTTISQIGIRYRSSPLTVNQLARPLAVKAGQRFPYLRTAGGKSLYDSLRAPLFHAILFTTGDGEASRREMEAVEQEFPGLVRVVVPEDVAGIRKRLKIRQDTVIVVRPDQYIGLVTDEGSRAVRRYLGKISGQGGSFPA